MDKNTLIRNIEIDLEHTERKIKHEINELKNSINRIEERMEEGRLIADDSPQGNEWRLYKHLAKYEEKKDLLKHIKMIDEYD